MKRLLPLILSLCLLTACTADLPQTDASFVEHPVTLCGREPSAILSAKAVAHATGREMEEGILEDVDYLAFTSVSGEYRVTVSVLETTRQYYDDLKAVYYAEDSQPLENLGEVALWSPPTGEVMAYSGGYLVSIWSSETDADTCRRIGVELMNTVLYNLTVHG